LPKKFLCKIIYGSHHLKSIIRLLCEERTFSTGTKVIVVSDELELLFSQLPLHREQKTNSRAAKVRRAKLVSQRAVTSEKSELEIILPLFFTSPSTKACKIHCF
jgi:hypothetical protein